MFAEATVLGTAVLVTRFKFREGTLDGEGRRSRGRIGAEDRSRSAVEDERNAGNGSGDAHSRRIACRSVRAMGVRVCAAPRC